MSDTIESVVHDHGDLSSETRPFGFWIYLMSDILLFAALFATFTVLRNHYAGGPSAAEIIDLRIVAVETGCLLTSSFTFGLAMLGLRAGRRNAAVLWMGATFILGATFVGLEVREFLSLISDGNGPDRSAFLSSFFTLVGTHGTHVSFGLIWIAVMIVQVAVKGFTSPVQSRLMRLGMFWHFLDIVWIGIFSIVYLMGVM